MMKVAEKIIQFPVEGIVKLIFFFFFAVIALKPI